MRKSVPCPHAHGWHVCWVMWPFPKLLAIGTRALPVLPGIKCFRSQCLPRSPFQKEILKKSTSLAKKACVSHSDPQAQAVLSLVRKEKPDRPWLHH